MMNRFILIASLGLWSATLCAQVPWEVPTDRNIKLSQTEFADQNRNTGKDLYMTNCKSCHGEPGKNNSRNFGRLVNFIMRTCRDVACNVSLISI